MKLGRRTLVENELYIKVFSSGFFDKANYPNRMDYLMDGNPEARKLLASYIVLSQLPGSHRTEKTFFHSLPQGGYLHPENETRLAPR